MENTHELYPEIDPYEHGYTLMDSGHSVYWELCGNPDGFPNTVVHGGPGAGCTANDRRYANPAKWKNILIDQRGSNRSRPFASIENNTTDDLLSDQWQILRSLGVKKTNLSGGSWGTFLSLAFAIRYPEMVSSMVLRGIFLGEKAELDYMYSGDIERFSPHYWERFISNVPLEHRHRILDYFYETMRNSSQEERRRLAYELSLFEEGVMHFETQPESEVEKETNDFPYEALGLLEAHYFINNCFVEEGFIMKNIHRLPKVPISIVQGKYDLVCPPISAYRLFKALREADYDVDLFLVTAGHSKSDTEIRKKLISETNRIYELVAPKAP